MQQRNNAGRSASTLAATADVAFLATEMVSVDGYILLQVLRKNKPDLLVVVLINNELNRIDAIHVGANGHFIKPVSVKGFSGEMREMLL